MFGGFDGFRLRLVVELFLFISVAKLVGKADFVTAPFEFCKMKGVLVYAVKFCCDGNKADFSYCCIVEVGNVAWVKFGYVKADLVGTITVEVGGAGAAGIEVAALMTGCSCVTGGLFSAN